jgi:hypothetical protein
MPPRAGWAASCSETSRGPVTVPWRTRPTNTHAWERIRHGSRATPRRRCAADPPRTAHPHGIAGSRDFRGERPPRALRGGRIIVPPLPRSRPCVRSPARVKQAAGRALHGRSRGDQLRMRTRDAFSAAARRSVRSNPAPCSDAAPDSRLGALVRRDVGSVGTTRCWERWCDAMYGLGVSAQTPVGAAGPIGRRPTSYTNSAGSQEREDRARACCAASPGRDRACNRQRPTLRRHSSGYQPPMRVARPKLSAWADLASLTHARLRLTAQPTLDLGRPCNPAPAHRP